MDSMEDSETESHIYLAPMRQHSKWHCHVCGPLPPGGDHFSTHSSDSRGAPHAQAAVASTY